MMLADVQVKELVCETVGMLTIIFTFDVDDSAKSIASISTWS